MRGLYLGIDLGTTNSKAAHLDFRGSDEFILPKDILITQQEDLDGTTIQWSHLPSVVQFDTDGKTVRVGEVARRHMSDFPDRTIRSIKRLMGKNWQYSLAGWNQVWTPEEISSLILRHLRERSLDHLHDTFDDLASVSISVPASFGGRQREATVNAARIAGFLGQVNLIDEPSAALVDYVYDQWQKGTNFKSETRVLVYDMGGGTLDVSIAQIDPTSEGLRIKILSRSRYTELAGTEFDLRLAAYIIHRWQMEGVPEPVSNVDKKNLYRTALFEMAEPLKIHMSRILDERLRWGFVREGNPFDLSDSPGILLSPRERAIMIDRKLVELPNIFVTIDEFLDVVEPFFKPRDEANPDGLGTIYGPIITALREANMRPEDIDTLLLHGGMSKLRLVQVGLMELYPQIPHITTTPNPMTSVARGAAIYQASRDGRIKEIEIEEPALFESIYIEYKNGFQLAVDKNTTVKSSGQVHLTIPPGSRRVRLPLYHGFSEGDPLLDYDRTLEIDLTSGMETITELNLRWSVTENRTVLFEWQNPIDSHIWYKLDDNSPWLKTNGRSPTTRRRSSVDFNHIHIQ